MASVRSSLWSESASSSRDPRDPPAARYAAVPLSVRLRRRSLPNAEAHFRDWRRCQLPRQGSHRVVARPTVEAAWPAGDDAEARPVHQRRPRHDEPVRARRGVRHRRRRRDRPRSRSLRALHRRAAVAQLQRHHRVDLPGGARRRAPRRLPGQDRAGDPAHHRRDQAADPSVGHRRRRRGDHRGRRHRRRHRDPSVPRGDSPVPQGGRPRQRLLPPRHAGAVHRAVGGAEDQADAALGHRVAQPRHPTRRDRVPQRGAAQRQPEAQDLQPVRRRRARRGQRRRRPQHLRTAVDPARRRSRRCRLRCASPRRAGRSGAHGKRWCR